jgi:hypothetical protein
MASILVPCWIWLLASIFLMGPARRLNSSGTAFRDTKSRTYRTQVKVLRRNMFPGQLVPLVLLTVGVLCVCVIVAGFALGAAKGSGHILPGPRYEITTAGLNGGAQTTVSASQYAYWEAQFVRLDAFFTLFGFVMIGCGLSMLQLHRTATTRAREPVLNT